MLFIIILYLVLFILFDLWISSVEEDLRKQIKILRIKNSRLHRRVVVLESEREEYGKE